MNLKKYIMKGKEIFASKISCSKKKIYILIISSVLGLALIMYVDSVQQNRFQCLRQGYEDMKNEQYSHAIEKFEKYLAVDSSLYWHILEFFNDDSYSRQNVIEAKELCVQYMND